METNQQGYLNRVKRKHQRTLNRELNNKGLFKMTKDLVEHLAKQEYKGEVVTWSPLSYVIRVEDKAYIEVESTPLIEETEITLWKVTEVYPSNRTLVV